MKNWFYNHIKDEQKHNEEMNTHSSMNFTHSYQIDYYSLQS